MAARSHAARTIGEAFHDFVAAPAALGVGVL
jgi:hypothetical protein